MSKPGKQRGNKQVVPDLQMQYPCLRTDHTNTRTNSLFCRSWVRQELRCVALRCVGSASVISYGRMYEPTNCTELPFSNLPVVEEAVRINLAFPHTNFKPPAFLFSSPPPSLFQGVVTPC